MNKLAKQVIEQNYIHFVNQLAEVETALECYQTDLLSDKFDNDSKVDKQDVLKFIHQLLNIIRDNS